MGDYGGGYGVAARLPYDRRKRGVDPLGPDNILGFTTGAPTAAPTATGTRWGVVAKSRLTGGWGDGNGSGNVGLAVRQAGFDMILFTGISPKPVHLLLKDGVA